MGIVFREKELEGRGEKWGFLVPRWEGVEFCPLEPSWPTDPLALKSSLDREMKEIPHTHSQKGIISTHYLGHNIPTHVGNEVISKVIN